MPGTTQYLTGLVRSLLPQSNREQTARPAQVMRASQGGLTDRSVTVAVIILAFNEERNILKAIDSVSGWATEIFVVDSYSTDATVPLALSREEDGVRVFYHEFEDYSKQWNWALQNLPITADWTLKLDADERATTEFKEEFSKNIPFLPPTVDGVYFRRSIHFLGKRLKFGGVRNNYDLRMWRTGAATFENRSVNEHAITYGDKIKFHSLVDHQDFKSLSHWLNRHNRYSSMEAIELSRGNVTGDIRADPLGRPDQQRMMMRLVYYRVPFRPLFYFFYRYILQLGFLDGHVGFQYALLRSAYVYWIDLKRDEYGRTGIKPEVIWPPRCSARPALPTVPIRKT